MERIDSAAYLGVSRWGFYREAHDLGGFAQRAKPRASAPPAATTSARRRNVVRSAVQFRPMSDDEPCTGEGEFSDAPLLPPDPSPIILLVLCVVKQCRLAPQQFTTL